VSSGKLLKVADSEEQFREMAINKRDEWFAQSDEARAAAKGLKPNPTQCIGFGVPLIFKKAVVKIPLILPTYMSACHFWAI
jgi:hypothetical protein